jgi:glucose uptake protein GlcU
MKHLKKLSLLPFALFWGIVGVRVEFFRSHFWLTILCGALSAVIVLTAVYLAVSPFRRGRALKYRRLARDNGANLPTCN